MEISRNQLLLGAAATLASTGLGACAGPSSVNSTPVQNSGPYDVIVVGAGISGISAARTALGYGAKVLVLEAQNRIGGRAFTDTTTFSEIGFDLGAQFFQACLSGNELLTIAQAQGLQLLAAAGLGPPNSLGSTIMTDRRSRANRSPVFSRRRSDQSRRYRRRSGGQAGSPDVLDQRHRRISFHEPMEQLGPRPNR